MRLLILFTQKKKEDVASYDILLTMKTTQFTMNVCYSLSLL